jgi:hypothetical protein
MENQAVPPRFEGKLNSGSRTFMIVLFALGLIFLSCAALSGLVYLFYFKPISSHQLNPSQLKAMLRVDDIIEHYEFENNKPGKVLAKIEKTLDGAATVTYEFESDDFYVLVELETSKSIQDAKDSYMGSQLVSSGIRKLEGENGPYREDASLFKWGDQMRFWHSVQKGEINGFELIARKQRMLVSVEIYGIELEKECADDFLIPKLDEMFKEFQN